VNLRFLPFLAAFLMGTNTFSGANTASDLSFEANRVDLGNIQTVEPIVHSMTITNDSDKPITITDSKSSCGCASSKVVPQTILPGKSGELTVTIVPQIGISSATLMIRYTDGEFDKSQILHYGYNLLLPGDIKNLPPVLKVQIDPEADPLPAPLEFTILKFIVDPQKNQSNLRIALAPEWISVEDAEPEPERFFSTSGLDHKIIKEVYAFQGTIDTKKVLAYRSSGRKSLIETITFNTGFPEPYSLWNYQVFIDFLEDIVAHPKKVVFISDDGNEDVRVVRLTGQKVRNRERAPITIISDCHNLRGDTYRDGRAVWLRLTHRNLQSGDKTVSGELTLKSGNSFLMKLPWEIYDMKGRERAVASMDDPG